MQKRGLLAWTDLLLIALAAALFPSIPKAEPPQTIRTKVVLLGTGTPAPDPDRSGPATAVVVDDVAYIVDLGPGVVRRARAAATAHSLKALEPTNLRIAFLTHLHSDHTIGFPDLIWRITCSRHTASISIRERTRMVISGHFRKAAKSTPTRLPVESCIRT